MRLRRWRPRAAAAAAEQQNHPEQQKQHGRPRASGAREAAEMRRRRGAAHLRLVGTTASRPFPRGGGPWAATGPPPTPLQPPSPSTHTGFSTSNKARCSARWEKVRRRQDGEASIELAAHRAAVADVHGAVRAGSPRPRCRATQAFFGCEAPGACAPAAQPSATAGLRRTARCCAAGRAVGAAGEPAAARCS